MSPGEAIQLQNFEPSLQGGYRRLTGSTKFNSEQNSEYNPLNITNYPKYKLIMDKWLNKAVYDHKIFEKGVKAKKRHILDLNTYIN